MNKPTDLFKENPVKWFLIPEYGENESKIIYYGNHGFIDGVQFFSILQAMTVEKDFSILPRVASPNLTTRIISEIMKPFATIKAAINLISQPKETNCIRGIPTDSNFRKAFVSECFDSRAIGKKCKEYKCSFNDAM